jgi:hypothetical protein
MPKYRVCIVVKEYSYIEVDATDELDAESQAWDKVNSGWAADVDGTDVNTEVYVEQELEEENENA